MAQGIAAIENALLDAKAKALGVPVYALLGGKLRDRIPLYWSHCATWRINHPAYYKPEITDLDGVKAIGREVREKGFLAAKTNIFIYEDGKPRGYRPGFGSPYFPELNIDKTVLKNLRMHLEALARRARPRSRPAARSQLQRQDRRLSEDPARHRRPRHVLDRDRLLYSPEALGYIRRQSPHPISSCETLLGLREFLPYFREQAMDVAIVDTPWNGVWQSMKIAACAEAHEVNVAPHNFYGHLCTMMNAHFAAAIPNLRIMEIDIDRLPWDDELFTAVPKIENGHLVMPDTPGWGLDPNEEALKAHPPKAGRGAARLREETCLKRKTPATFIAGVHASQNSRVRYGARLSRRQDHDHLAALEARLHLDLGDLGGVFLDAVEQPACRAPDAPSRGRGSATSP